MLARSLYLLLILVLAFASPAQAADGSDKGVERGKPPQATPERKLQLEPLEAAQRMQTCGEKALQLGKAVAYHIEEHLKAADSFDVETFRTNDDALNDVYDQSDANLLEWQMVADAAAMPSPELSEAREQLKTAKLSSYKSSAIFYLCFGQPVQASQCARLALSIAEANEREKDKIPDILFYFGAASFWSGEYQRSEEHLKQALALNPDNPYALYYLGDLYIAQGSPTKAIAWLASARERATSDDARGHLDRALALAYKLNRQPKLARQHIELARSELDASYAKQMDAMTAESRGVVAALAGDYDLAERTLTESLAGLKVSPLQRGNRLEAAQACLWRSYCRHRLGDKAGAAEDRRYALSFADEGTHLLTLAHILDPLFDFKEAAVSVTEAVRDRWALVIGVGDFSDPSVPRLRYPAKDARDIQQLLVQQEGFKPTHVRLLVNSEATRSAIVDNLASGWLPAVSRPGDLILVFISSHGTPAYKDIGAFNSVVAYDTVLDHLFTTSLPMQSIVRTIRSKLPNRRAFVVLDTCYAGGLGAPLGSSQSAVDPEMLVSSRFQLLLSSSDSNERSWESKRYANSVFTRQLINTLEQNPSYQDFHSIFQLLKERVQQEVSSDFRTKQTPTIAGRWSGKGLTRGLK